jgi:hypothetical protein
MAIINADDLFTKIVDGAYDKGNAFVEQYRIAKAANATDVLRVGYIPAGVCVTMFFGTFADTGTGNTLDVGYEYALTAAEKTLYGVSDAPAYWWDNLDTATGNVASTRSAGAYICFDHPVYITVLVNSANFTGTPAITFDVIGKATGPK